MKCRHYIEDMVDVISLILSIIAGVAIAACIKNSVDPALAESRGYEAVGGEFILYGVVFLLVAFFLFQVFTNIGHKIEEM